MNDKENLAVGGGISAEQRARISQNFRAAKALLARKRPRESDHLSVKHMDAKGIASQVAVNRRVPLSDILVNTSTPGSVKNFSVRQQFIYSECVSNSFTNFSSNINDNSNGKEIEITVNQGAVLDSFRTPIRQLECLPLNKIESSDGIPTGLISKDMVAQAEHGKVFDSFKTLVRRLDCSVNSCSMDMTVSRVESCNCVIANVSAKQMTELAENGKALSPFKFPIRKLECTGGSCSKGFAGNRIGLSNSVSADNGTVPDLIETSIKRLDRFESGQGGLTEWENSVVAGDDFEMNSYITPLRQHECSSLSESIISCGTLDEDFDDSILQEIDALCENKPEVVAGRKRWNSNKKMRSQSSEMNRDVCYTNVGPVVSEEMVKTEGNLGPSAVQGCYQGCEEGSRTSEATQIGCMPAAYAKYMQSLNDRQREAACSDISVPLMIVAGPGSGKTSTMVGRVLMLLNEGIGPSHILAMTFTTAAAAEMRDRIGAVTGKAIAKELMISTFHSFSLQLCRSHAEKLERTPEFLIYGQGQQRRAIIEAVRLLENGKNGENNDLCKLDEESNGKNSPRNFKDKSKKWLKYVTQAKASGKNPEECQKMGDEIGAAILQNYGNILKSCDALDYHDLISCSVKLLTDFPEVMKECQESWKAIVIDEFQDTSAMQYGLLRILASNKQITIVGDEDQSIFSFNGADAFGFKSFRKDFPLHKEVRLNKNYRSTRCIIEAASFLIRNNSKRSESKDVLTDNSSGSKITIKECCTEEAQCSFVVDKILEIICDGKSVNSSFGNVAVLYRRQVSGKMFQTAFRDRKIPFNVHGVAFYRKKVVRAIISMLRTTLPGCDDGSFRRVFKVLLPIEKEEKKKVIEHIDKISTIRKASFISVACDIFSAKISGTLKRSQLTQGRKVVVTLDMISKLVHREHSISAVITSVANMIPQKYLLEQRAVLDVDGGKLLNEDNDLRSVLQYLLDDVSEFLTTQKTVIEGKRDTTAEDRGCANALKSFIDYISERESQNFRSRRHDNEHSVTLTTIHQSKGLEWDTVFIVKANESEIPLLHEYNGVAKESTSSLEEERRLLYVAITRARKKLFILYVLMDSNWQVLQPSRFLKEIPKYLQEVQDEPNSKILQTEHVELPKETHNMTVGIPTKKESTKADMVLDESSNVLFNEVSEESTELIQACNGSSFLKRFSTEVRTVVSHLFHQWAKKAAFQEPKRLLDKVGFVIDERLRIRKSTHKDVLRELKSCLRSDDAFQYAEYVLKWEQIPADKRAYIMREKQEHFQKLRIESAMGSSAPTSKQIGYLRSLGCTVVPTSRLHASRLIEQYKSL